MTLLSGARADSVAAVPVAAPRRAGWRRARRFVLPLAGFAVALVSTIPMFLFYYAVQPLPGTLVMRQELFATAQMLLLGVIAALLNPRPKTN